MKMRLWFLVPALILSFGSATLSLADEPMRPESPHAPLAPETLAKIVRGDVLAIEGEFYVVKDTTGHEVRLHVNQDTKMDSKLKVKVGDKIEAHVTSDGHATSITLQIPQSSKAGPQG